MNAYVSLNIFNNKGKGENARFLSNNKYKKEQEYHNSSILH